MLILAVAGVFRLWAVDFAEIRMPFSPFADSEISTDLEINRSDINYAEIHFAFGGTPTNNLELAFGTDTNIDGILEPEEVEMRFGWRMGRYFVENVLTGERLDSEPFTEASTFLVKLQLGVRFPQKQVRRIVASGTNATGFSEILSSTPPSWIWRREWNLMRVTRRGTEVPSDWLYYKASKQGLYISVR